MPRTNRNTLKEYFKRGSMPNQKLTVSSFQGKQSRHQLIHEHTRQYS